MECKRNTIRDDYIRKGTHAKTKINNTIEMNCLSF